MDRIDELSAAQDQIHDREERLAAILKAAVDAIVTIDRTGTITGANPATERMFGYTKAELLGSNVKMLMPAPYRDEHDGYLARYAQTREPHIIGVGREVTGLRKDGSAFPVHLAVSEIDHMGLFTGIVRDLTDLKRTQDKLIQSERLAAIGQTMTGLAHESRNALQRTRACLDMLELDLDGQPDLLDLVKRGQTALDELHRLYEEVRDYAAPSHPELALSDLSRVWETAWANLSVSQTGKKIRFDVQPNGVDLSCRIDPHRIGQVLRNLFENAVAATTGDGTITLKCADADIDGRDAVRISVRDDGPGFPPDSLDNIFEPFFTTKTKGTGLGMAIAKRIIEEHGGKIAVNNAPEGGAEVELVLPRSPSPSRSPTS